MKNIAVFVSGSGSDMQSIIDACESGFIPDAKVSYVVASKDGIFAIQRAINHGIKYGIFSKKSYSTLEDMYEEIMHELKSLDIDLIVLAGYLTILSSNIVKEYDGRIINIHPSLIPKHCGIGYYGIKVHRSVIESGDKISGATVHFVDETADTGKIIMQETVEVKENDTAETLAARVLELEHSLLPRAVKKVLREV